MAKKSGSEKEKVEFQPDAWSRFERAMAVVVKSPPQHRAKAKGKSGRNLKKKTPPKRGQS
jgi:hypothetical protein